MVDMTVSTTPVKTTEMYQAAKDKNVAATIVYVDSDNALFYDSAFTNAVSAADCLDLFAQGVLAFKDDTYYKPVSCTAAGVINFGLS